MNFIAKVIVLVPQYFASVCLLCRLTKTNNKKLVIVQVSKETASFETGKVNKLTRELLQSESHQVLNIKAKRQTYTVKHLIKL